MDDTFTKTVLVVEDEETLREALSVRLGRDGHAIVTADTANAAIAAIEEHGPEVLVLDLGLGEGSGFEVLQHVREQVASEKQPAIVVYSGFSDPTVRAKVMGWGVSLKDYLLKVDHTLDDVAARVIEKLDGQNN